MNDMGDKDSPLDGLCDGKERVLTFYDVTDGKGIGDSIIADSLAYELPVVEDSLRFDEDHDKLVDPFPKNKMSFSFICRHPDFKKWLNDNPLTRAQDMSDALKRDLEAFYVSNPPRNRKERRTRARELEKKIARFKEYCKENNIEFKNNP